MRRLALAFLPAFLPALAACGGPGPSFCERATELQSADLTRGDLEGGVAEALDTLDDLVASAPDEIVADVAAVRDGVEDYVAGRSVDDGYAAASARVSEHIAEECR